MERDLIDDAVNGNKNALATLLRDNYEIVFRYLLKLTLDKNVAEDITQEAMVRAIEKFELYNPDKAKFSTWLIAIAQNLFMDSIRRKKTEQGYVDRELQLEDLYDVIKEHDENWDRTLEALHKLSDESRTPLVMKHYYGYSLNEIAKIMALPLGTVKSRIFNAIKALRKELS